MVTKRLRRRLASGEERTYIYEVDGEEQQTLGIANSSDSSKLYRSQDFCRIVAILQAASSLLVVGEAGCGKTVLGELVTSELRNLGFLVAVAQPTTTKQTMIKIASQLGVDLETLEGKALTIQGLQEAIADFLSKNTAFLICDDAQRLQPEIRYWLEKLHEQEQPMLLLAKYPPARDIFVKLPRIELKPLKNREIREIMKEAAKELGLDLPDGQLAQLQERCGGNPMLAKRVIREEFLGLEETSPDHIQWIDGTSFLVAGLMMLVIVRFLGLGFNSTSLYIIGGIITVGVGIVKLLLYSLPRKSGRLGR